MSARMTVAEAAVEARRHPDTIRKALEAQDLHGTQQVARGKWSVKAECLDAWLDGVPCVHKNNVTQIGAARSA
jgi:hypothetical protein